MKYLRILSFLCIVGACPIAYSMTCVPDKKPAVKQVSTGTIRAAEKSTVISESPSHNIPVYATPDNNRAGYVRPGRTCDVNWRPHPHPLDMPASDYHWMLSGWSSVPSWATSSTRNLLRLSGASEENASELSGGLSLLVRASQAGGPTSHSPLFSGFSIFPNTSALVLLLLTIAAKK